MSVRPKEVANEASRFSLRSFFSSEDQVASATQPQTAPQPPSPTALQPQQPQQLRFDLAGAAGSIGPPLLPLATGPTGAGVGLKFTLPTMRPAETGALHVSSRLGGEKKLQAGYVTGGFARSNDPEIMRLNGTIDELTAKLKKSAERISTAEQSVARGNAALQSERATAHARIVALAGEVKNAQQREANVRAELASVPKLENFDQAKFEMQARGAVELQAKYDEEVSRAAALQSVLDGINEKHEALLSEHAGLQVHLDDAIANLSAARDAEAAALAAAATASEAAAAATAMAPAPKVDAMFMQEKETLKDALAEKTTALAAQQELLAAEQLRNHEADTMIAALDAKLADAREEARTAKAQHEKLEAFTLAMSSANAAPAPTEAPCPCSGGAAEEDEPTDEGEPAVAVAPAAASDTEEDAEPATFSLSVEDEVAIPVMPLKDDDDDENVSPNVAFAAPTAAAPPAPLAASRRVLETFERYFLLKQAAEHAAAAVECAGEGASQPLVDAAAHARDRAEHAYWGIVNDEVDAPAATGCCADVLVEKHGEEAETVSAAALEAIREQLATALNVNCFQMGISSLAFDDCRVDFHAVPAATGRVTLSQTAEPVGLQMRTNRYVSAVSEDIKAELKAARNAWVQRQLGEAPEPIAT